MDISSFPTLSIKNQRQVLEDFVVVANLEAVREHVEREQTAAEERATIIRAQVEAVKEGGTQAHDKAPGSSHKPPQAGQVQNSQALLP